jgi:cell division protein FtsQ
MWSDVLALNRLTALMVVAVLVLLAWAGAQWLAAQPRFAIRSVLVQSAGTDALSHVTAEQVARACVPRLRGTFFTADLSAAKAAFESLPWVRSASVRRQWPDRLVVRLEEHQALARWNDDAGNRFVSDKGEAFQAPGEAALGARLPLLTGPEGSEAEVARRFGEFRDRLAVIRKTPQVVTLSPRQAWTLRLSDGLVVEIGREQPASSVLSRLERFVTHYGATAARLPGRVEVADLRYPNGFAIRAQGLRTPAAPLDLPARKQNVPARKAKPVRGRT